jgi:hypothetical protein
MPTDRAGRVSAKVLRSAGLGLLLALAACTFEIGPASVPRPDVIYEPDVAGLVSGGDCDHVTDTCTLTVDGETVEIGPGARNLYGEGRGGELLLYGSEDDTVWYANVSIASTTQRAGCGALDNSNAWDEGDSILFAFTSATENDPVVGIRLPKSEKWDEDIALKPDGRFPANYNGWCLDLHGRVSAVYPGHE